VQDESGIDGTTRESVDLNIARGLEQIQLHRRVRSNMAPQAQVDRALFHMQNESVNREK